MQLEKTIKESGQKYEVLKAQNGIDGMTLAEMVRKKKELDNVEILFLTTECCLLRKLEAKDVGVRGWVPKPLKPNSLLENLEKIMRHLDLKTKMMA